MKTFSIFICSPGDVVEERVLALRVISRLQSELADTVKLQPVYWEHEPLLATAGFQEQLTKPSQTDLVISILWSRLGTRLPARFRRPDGSHFESGTEFEFEDAIAAHRTTGKPDLLVYRKTARPIFRLDDEVASLESIRQKKALDAFFEKWFYDTAQRAFIGAFHSFGSPGEFEELLEIHLRKLIERRVPGAATAITDAGVAWRKGSPFRGLQVFEFEHAPIFFGRTQAVADILQALRRQAAEGRAFVLVLGMSGGGKSSVVRAGVLPMLAEAGVIEGVAHWRRAIFRPSEGTADLLYGLARSLVRAPALPELDMDGKAAAALSQLLRKSPEAALAFINRALKQAGATAASGSTASGNGGETRLVIVIDQMEEMFTSPMITTEQRRDFLTAVDALARSGHVWVIATLRSDFYPRCAEIGKLAALKEGAGQYDLRPPSAAEIGQMIRMPTRAAGLRFEEDETTGARLDDVLRDAAAERPEVLPLLEFTLEELYQHRTDNGVLTFDAYRQLGGVEGSIAQRAEKVFDALPETVQQALPRVLNDLISITEADRTVGRRPFPRDEVETPEANALLDAFVEARLFVMELADDGRAIVNFAHEALLQHWPRVRAWIDDNKESLRVRARVSAAARHWDEAGRDKDLLLPRGQPLSEARQLLQKEIDLGAQERELIAASLAKARRIARLRVGFVTMLVVLAFTAGFAAIVAFDARDVANQRREQADDLIGFMLGDLRQKLEPIGRLDVLDSVGAKVREYLDSLMEEEITDEALEKRALAYRQIGEVRKAQGNLEAAMQDFQASLADSQLLSRRDPTNGEWLFNLAQAHFWVGYIHREWGDLNAAAIALRHYVSAAERLAALDPDNNDWQLEVGYSNAALGAVLYSQGELADALDQFRHAQAVEQRLTERNPDNTELLLSMAESTSWVGTALIALGDLRGALEQFEAEAAIKRSIAESDPKNAAWQRRHALALRRTGELLEAMGELDRARAAYAEAMAITAVLVAQDPANTSWQRDLAVLYGGLGRLSMAHGDRATAIDNFQRYKSTAQALLAQDNTNRRWQRDLAQSHTLSGAAFIETEDYEAAATESAAAIKTLEGLVRDQADDREAQRLLSRAYLLQGRILERTGDEQAARVFWQRALEHIEPLARGSRDCRVVSVYATALLLLDRTEEADPVVQELRSMGFHDPHFSRLFDDHTARGLPPRQQYF